MSRLPGTPYRCRAASLRPLRGLLACWLIAGIALPAGAGEPNDASSVLRVMSFNIRWQGLGADGHYYDSQFERRKPLVLDVLRDSGADLVGLQEASIEQRSELAAALPGFAMYPGPAAAGDECILYRRQRFEFLDGGRATIRARPERVGTTIGQRDFFWVRLRDRLGGYAFYLLNLHLDHRSGQRGRQLDAVRIGEWLRARPAADPVILLGDLNGGVGQPRYLYLTGQRQYPDSNGRLHTMPEALQDSFRAVHPESVAVGTAHGYSGRRDGARIDYILVSPGTRLRDARILYHQAGGQYPSDHFPVMADIDLRSAGLGGRPP